MHNFEKTHCPALQTMGYRVSLQEQWFHPCFFAQTAQPGRIQTSWSVPAPTKALRHQRDYHGVFVFLVNLVQNYHHSPLQMKLPGYHTSVPYQEIQLVGTAAVSMSPFIVQSDKSTCFPDGFAIKPLTNGTNNNSKM